MSIADIKKNAEQKMLKSIEAFKNELAKVRTGRAHPGILDQVQIDYYGSMVPISQVANLTLIDARTISVMRGLDPRIHDEHWQIRALRNAAFVERHHGLPGQGPAMTAEVTATR